ncbi:alpha/beta fold hydrolase [Beijerinckia indica]|uniref:Alpha/beta hydrolase fold n=1 Tax=Beijerinckia indica subsp. indica (strain ATCC 9039 / DSM 1715 / NCIMB 8712) TaxID=395963 RepID=B2IE98_BEII9|nr:alpha/beta hydrolase [Beijerinckia indica]ACB95496.1 alpha/beta hydrolase fold [Beijerinckia indica subsp. indica ATCC 9039]
MTASTIAEPPAFTHRYYTSADGLRLHVRDYAPQGAVGVPVVCLSGLTRNSTDFDPLAQALAGGLHGAPRRVLAFDYRGRGLSAHDPDWQKYTLAVEHGDILRGLAEFSIEQATFVGTSRGGLHIMLMGVLSPAVLHAAVLNDIGPVIEPKGIARICGYLGKTRSPTSLEEAVAALKATVRDDFPALSEAEWEIFARQTFMDEQGHFGVRYDPALSKQFEALNPNQPFPPAWPQFEALAKIPLLVVRGDRSDLLSDETLREMAARHPNCETYTIAGQGHAPPLIEAPVIARLCQFIAKAG